MNRSEQHSLEPINAENLQENLISQKQRATRSTLVDHDPNEKKEVRKAKDMKKAFGRLFSYSWRNKGLFLVGNVGLAVSSGGMVLLPLLCGMMIDDIKEGNDLLNDALQFMILTVVMAVFTAIRGYCYMLLGERVVFEMRKELFIKLLEKDIEYYDKIKSGELISRLTSDVSTVYAASSDNISMLFRNILQFFGSLVFLWIISWKLTLLIIVLTPIISFVILFIIKLMKNLQKEYSNNLAYANSLANEVFGNIRVVKSFSNEVSQNTNYTALLDKVYKTGRKKHLFYGIMLLIMTLFANFLILSILYFGGTLTIDGEISIGDLTSFVLYTITLTVGFASISGIINQIISALGVCEHLFEIMDEPIKIMNGAEKTKFKSKNANAIEFENVSFSYPSKDSVQVLKNINLKVKQGQSVAIVGPSGSGKSSIVSLILRFYDATDGEIKIGGKNIKHLDLEQMRRQIGYVSQEPTLFSGNLRENVQYGLQQSEKSQDKLLRALEVANAKQFAMNENSFPQKLQTLVGERGVKLSGGQKQRIAIARCIIKEPSLLIFDEATSALDSESEYLVQKAIDGLVEAKDRTMIIVAHRLSTIINCDRIIVLKSGQIVQEGKHQELLNLGGIYANLVHKQLSSLN